MGCMASSQRISARIVPTNPMHPKSLSETHKGETVLAALTRLDEEISSSERTQPVARLAVVSAELDSIQQEIKQFEETTSASTITKDSYAKTLHQLFIGLDLYKRPMLASENEDFVANVNRKEMRRLELCWLRTRYAELLRERRVLHAQILRIRSLYAQLQQLLGSIWGSSTRPGTPLEGALTKASALRDALAQVSARLRAAAEYAHAAVRMLDDALPAWKLTTVGKSGWERTTACADACRHLVQARCAERGARRVLAAPAAPRAARTLRLALDYAFTDAMHDHKYQRATEIFFQFKEALVLLIDSIHRVLLNNLENLAAAEKDVAQCRKELRASRVNAIVQKGLAELKYEPKALTSLNVHLK
ncbi:BH3-only protein sayonara [Anticarsia gemmatalis]|uniref:BH3-only protein sayonara n=1 Tax=Anticarsia gemmatalis TaxID=129554 RepID=UPI003F7605BB